MTINVRNLTKKFKDFVAVNGVSFDVEAGETFALLGPNGSGKTTTLKCMVGLTLPTSGNIAVEQHVSHGVVGGIDLLRRFV